MGLSPDGAIPPTALIRAGIACLCEASKAPLEKYW